MDKDLQKEPMWKCSEHTPNTPDNIQFYKFDFIFYFLKLLEKDPLNLIHSMFYTILDLCTWLWT